MARTKGSDARVTGPRIRQAAETLFAEQGYAAVSMRRIAAEVGVQAGALYQYFPDKQTLLFDLIDTHMTARLAAWRALEEPDDPVDRLRAFTEFHIRYHLERPDAAVVAVMELRNLTPENRAAIEAKRRAYEAELQWILDFGRDEGAFHFPDVGTAAAAILAMLTDATLVQRGPPPPPRRLARSYWRFVQRLVRARRVDKDAM